MIKYIINTSACSLVTSMLGIGAILTSEPKVAVTFTILGVAMGIVTVLLVLDAPQQARS